ncbi:P-loop NTPase fold protein [Gordonia sp. CPCC 205515]|uniref:P-loop NTPase fold protein n=1 Tax=Gordonia sp. CPCC 205515 TaxID=3140791 RepID=UPI003AF34C66
MNTTWNDAPITSCADDEFGRAGYAIHTADLIAASHTWDDSIVFGLTGPWGSGKSSVVAMICEQLQNRHSGGGWLASLRGQPRGQRRNDQCARPCDVQASGLRPLRKLLPVAPITRWRNAPRPPA